MSILEDIVKIIKTIIGFISNKSGIDEKMILAILVFAIGITVLSAIFSPPDDH